MLKIQNLSVSQAENRILQEVNLALPDHTMSVVVGPNGSGKSTLARVIAENTKDTDLSLDTGKIEWNDENITHKPTGERSLLGIFLAHQSPPSIEGLNIFSYLRLIHGKHSQEKIPLHKFDQILNEKLDILNLPQGVKKRNLNENFSGGERKKLELLQMLLTEPDLLILDEIDSGVDIDSLKTIMKAITNYQESHKPTTLFVTHNLPLAGQIESSHLFVLRKGRVVLETNKAPDKRATLERIKLEGYESL